MSVEGLPIRVLKRDDRLSDRVAKQMEELILDGVLKSGQRLPAERELSEMFWVSRTVIREALRNLSARGLLDDRVGGGTYVQAPDTDAVARSLKLLLRAGTGGIAIEDVHEVRQVVEVEIAVRAAQRATDEDIADLKDILQRMETAPDSEVAAALDVEFHQALAVAAHNPLYIVLLDSIGDILMEVRRMAFQDGTTLQTALDYHHEVLDAVGRQDPELARTAMLTHMAEAQRTMRDSLKRRGHRQKMFRMQDGDDQEA